MKIVKIIAFRVKTKTINETIIWRNKFLSSNTYLGKNSNWEKKLIMISGSINMLMSGKIIPIPIASKKTLKISKKIKTQRFSFSLLFSKSRKFFILKDVKVLFLINLFIIIVK